MTNKPIKLYIYMRLLFIKSAVLITIRCEKTRCEKKANRVLGAVTHTTVNGFSHGKFSRVKSHLGF